MAKPFSIDTYTRRPELFQPVANTPTCVTTIRDEVWTKKTLHLKGLKQIAREISHSYTETEELLVEAAMAHGERLFKAGVRLGRTMPRIPVGGVAA